MVARQLNLNHRHDAHADFALVDNNHDIEAPAVDVATPHPQLRQSMLRLILGDGPALDHMLEVDEAHLAFTHPEPDMAREEQLEVGVSTECCDLPTPHFLVHHLRHT
jgi:hypothetical protein